MSLRSTRLLLLVPLVVAAVLLAYSTVNLDRIAVSRLIRDEKVGLDPVRTPFVRQWLDSLAGVVDEPIVLNPKSLDGQLTVLTEREPGDIFTTDIDAVYLPGAHSIIISRGLVDLGTNSVNTDDFREDLLANAEDTQGYQLFIFVMLHELGHSKLHKGHHGFFGLTRSCHLRTRIEQEADEFAAHNILNAPYGYVIWYGQPESEFSSEDGYAIATFHRLLQSEWRAVKLPDRYGSTSIDRSGHLANYFGRLASELERLHNIEVNH